MSTTSTPHLSDQTLQSYSLGTIDAMLTNAVQSHLSGCGDCRRRVAELSSDRPSEPDRGAPSGSDSMPQGLADHPDYQILRELGRGNMGVVYLAENRLMGRKEVLKVVGSHLANRKIVQDRFLREIRAAAQLNHPNIVTAYSAIRLGESIVFSMAYVEGFDLDELVKRSGPLQVDIACKFIHQAAQGLQHAHERGMVHRDIKPNNLRVGREGDRPIVKILDFGLAKVNSEAAVEGGLTRDGQMLGTPYYVAPEQILDAQRADIRADIYSLGCTLYYLLAGRPPFEAGSLYELLEAHHRTDATPLNQLRPEVPVGLAALVGKMMAKEPDRRFQTPREAADELARYVKPRKDERPAPTPTRPAEAPPVAAYNLAEAAFSIVIEPAGLVRPPKRAEAAAGLASAPLRDRLAMGGFEAWKGWPIGAAAAAVAAIGLAGAWWITVPATPLSVNKTPPKAQPILARERPAAPISTPAVAPPIAPPVAKEIDPPAPPAIEQETLFALAKESVRTSKWDEAVSALDRYLAAPKAGSRLEALRLRDEILKANDQAAADQVARALSDQGLRDVLAEEADSLASASRFESPELASSYRKNLIRALELERKRRPSGDQDQSKTEVATSAAVSSPTLAANVDRAARTPLRTAGRTDQRGASNGPGPPNGPARKLDQPDVGGEATLERVLADPRVYNGREFVFGEMARIGTSIVPVKDENKKVVGSSLPVGREDGSKICGGDGKILKQSGRLLIDAQVGESLRTAFLKYRFKLNSNPTYHAILKTRVDAAGEGQGTPVLTIVSVEVINSPDALQVIKGNFSEAFPIIEVDGAGATSRMGDPQKWFQRLGGQTKVVKAAGAELGKSRSRMINAAAGNEIQKALDEGMINAARQHQLRVLEEERQIRRIQNR